MAHATKEPREMNADEESPNRADGTAPRLDRPRPAPPRVTTSSRAEAQLQDRLRPEWLINFSHAPLLVAAALASGLLAFLAAGAGAATASGSGTATGDRTHGTSGAATAPGASPTRPVDEWAACERSHGDPNQPVPTIGDHRVIHVTFSPSAMTLGDAHDATGTCSRYLVAAQSALRAAHPVRDPQGVGQAAYLRCVRCITNGVDAYPYPEANDPSQTDLRPAKSLEP